MTRGRTFLGLLAAGAAWLLAHREKGTSDEDLERFSRNSTPVWPSLNNDFTDMGRPFEDYKRADPELPCHGCGHSAAREPFPGMPSGERPCGFCVRNPEGIAPWVEDHGAVWYDGKTPAFKVPMDCYIATDRSTQNHIFSELARYETEGKPIPPRELIVGLGPDPDGVWCCEGGDGPGGHTWTCWRWLGIRFG